MKDSIKLAIAEAAMKRDEAEAKEGARVLLTFRSASGQVWEGAAICGPLRDTGSGREIALEDTALMDLKLTAVRVVLP